MYVCATAGMKNITLRIRIYISMMLLLLFSFLVIGAASYVFFKNQNEQYHKRRLARNEHEILESLNFFIDENRIEQVNQRLELKIQELANVNSLDIHVFDIYGDLLGSTNINVFDSGYVSFQIPQDVLFDLNNSDTLKVMRPMVLNGIEYFSAYFFLFDYKNYPLAILNIPYYKNEEENKRELADFLTTLSEIYIVLLLAGLVAAYLLSTYITNSLKLISSKLTEAKIGTNEPIIWESNDEIGSLVEAYNLKVQELEHSLDKLAKTEREIAWKEMARQVAHEIKNPLTPMKLSVQHLQRTYSVNDEGFKDRLSRFAQTMVDQMDTLAAIATAFSDFAKLPKPEMEPIYLYDVLQGVAHLFASQSEGELNVELNFNKDLQILADKNQLHRVYVNLIKNAFQAIDSVEQGQVELHANFSGGTITTAVRDNGVGISDEVREKIFEPNFTTKSSGTGLGLAMVKRMVEQMNGSIHFTSEAGKGATFFVEFKVKE